MSGPERLSCSSEQGSNAIRLYDGRGDGKPMETITNLHRFPVHLLTVCTWQNMRSITSHNVNSTAIDLTASYLLMKTGLSSTGSPQNLLNFQRMSGDYGNSSRRQTSSNSKRFIPFLAKSDTLTVNLYSLNLRRPASRFRKIRLHLSRSPFQTVKSAFSPSFQER